MTAEQLKPQLSAVLSGLSSGDRELLLLVAWAGLSYEESAQALGLTVSAVKSRLHRIRVKTRNALGEPTRRWWMKGPDMDEITLFTALRPARPEDAGELLEAARGRLTCALGGPAGQSARPGRRRRARPPRRTVLLAACATVVAACAAIVIPAVLPGRDAGSLVTAAWAVQHNPDGTIKVTFKQSRDAAGLQRALRADGVPAYVRYIPWVATGANHYRPAATCGQTGPGNLPGGPLNVMILNEVFPFLAAGGAPAGDALTIRPAAIPKGDTILIEVTWFPGHGGFGADVGDEVLGNGNPPTCTPTR